MPRTRQFERILPQPATHLIVNLGAPYRVVRRGEELVDAAFPGAFVSGVQSASLVIENPEEIHQVSAELAPFGLAALSATAPQSLAGAVVSADRVIDGAETWPRRLRSAATPADALDAFEELLAARLAGAPDPDPIVVAACDTLDTDPDLPIATLARRLGVSATRLLSAFRAACGVTPKAYADLARFHAFVGSIPFTDPPRWSDLVASTGYYDQPHFIRSFRRFVGCTPSEYHAGVMRHGAEFALFVPLDVA